VQVLMFSDGEAARARGRRGQSGKLHPRKNQRRFPPRHFDAILVGTGVGMPMGILNPQSGVRACDTAASTPVGQINWQDLIM
jgi:hypothetical protein